MPYELLYRQAADETLDSLEADAAESKALDAIDDCLDRLEDDPFDRHLGTHIFQTAEGDGVSATPVRFDDWYVFWQRGSEPGTIEIIAVSRLEV